MSACIYDDYPPTSSGTANMKANATLIAAAPTITAELIAARRKMEAAEGLVDALSSLLPQNLGPLPKHMADTETVPVDMTFGEIRATRAALAKWEAMP